LRGCGFAVGASFLFGPRFGITFGAFSTVGQIVAYRWGIRPSLDYAPSTHLRVTKHQILAGVNRTVGYAIAGYISALVGNEHANALRLGLEAGLIIGVVTVIAGGCTPVVEWTADHMPAKRMGVIGVGLIVTGFLLQSVQYWVTLLGPKVK